MMNWRENKTVKKWISVISYVCLAVYLGLGLLEAVAVVVAPKPIVIALLGVVFLGRGLVQTGKEKIWGYSLAAGWFLIALLYCF